jgi:hypothetical protein
MDILGILTLIVSLGSGFGLARAGYEPMNAAATVTLVISAIFAFGVVVSMSSKMDNVLYLMALPVGAAVSFIASILGAAAGKRR